MGRSQRIRVLVAIDTIALLALAALLGYGYHEAMQASSHYQQIRAHLSADIQAAKQDGLSAAALIPITSQLSSLDGSQPPLLPSARTDLYRSDARTAARLEADLAAARQSALQAASNDTAAQLAATQAAIEHDQQIEVPDSSLATYRERLAAINKATTAARKIKDWQSLAGQATDLRNNIAAAGVLQEQENAAIQQAAVAVLQQSGANIGALQQAGNAALVNGRNDATVASYEAKPGRFTNIAALMGVYNQLEHYAGRLASPDVNQVAYGTAAIQKYSGQVHQMLLKGLGPKHIIVSFQAQRAWAYENGNVVMDSLVTTGIRGATAFGTDFGPMKVLFKSHPYTMRSPWPKTSSFWYPNTVVQWTTFFTASESFHDASWEPDSLLGPGSQFNASTRSHGCIHLPYNLAQWLFGWAAEGTPVDVVPANGQPVAEQLSEMTTDSQGNPLNPVL
jgi:lipoprotein-anchoring transpeptidase ErfK/SrfK